MRGLKFIYNVNAFFLQEENDMAYISGTNGNDDLYSGRNADHLDGGAGDDR